VWQLAAAFMPHWIGIERIDRAFREGASRFAHFQRLRRPYKPCGSWNYLAERNSGGGFLLNGLVSIIIVTRNSAPTLPACLASVNNQTYTDYEVILADNGSQDETLSLIHPETVTLLTNATNLGFAKANNQALGIAKGEFVLFLNSDAAIEPDFLALSIPCFRESRRLGAIAGKIVKPGNRGVRIIDSAGLMMEHWRLLPRDRGEGEMDKGQYNHRAWVFGVPGACALYRRTALNSVALGQEVMDEDFFAYYEDVDLAWRVRRQDWTALYVPEAIACHEKKGPRGKEEFIQVKAFTNRYWCYIKNARTADFLLYAPLAIPYEIMRVCKALLLNPSWIPAYFNEWRLLARILKKRRVIQRANGTK
jgi:GT2 family glycosyltransferase